MCVYIHEAAHFLRKSDCLGCAVLLCLVVVYLTLLASFFRSSHLSLKHVYLCVGRCLIFSSLL